MPDVRALALTLGGLAAGWSFIAPLPTTSGADRPARPFEVHGDEVNGTTQPADAPTLEPGEHYVDALPATGATTHYEIRRDQPASVLTISVTGPTTPGGELLSAGTVSMTIADTNGTTCGQSTGRNPASPNSLLTMLVSTPSTTGFDADDPCQTNDVLFLTITQDVGDIIENKPIEIAVTEEQHVARLDELPPVAADPEWTPMVPSSAPSTVAGAASLEDAPLLEPGSVSSTIMPGEALVYRVPLEWGQRVQAQADIAVPDQELSTALGLLQIFSLELIGPAGGDATALNGEAGESRAASITRDAPTTIGVTMPEARYLNREDSEISGAGYAGDYYLIATLMDDTDGESYVVPFTLTIDVLGEAGAGAPEFTEVPTGAATADPVGTSPRDSSGNDELATGLAVCGIGMVAAGMLGIYRWWLADHRRTTVTRFRHPRPPR